MRHNPYLFSMTLVGVLLLLLGGFLAIWGVNAVGRGLLDLIWMPGLGGSIGSLGLLLLIIAWTVAAARWRP
jgi:hypothetical protein